MRVLKIEKRFVGVLGILIIFGMISFSQWGFFPQQVSNNPKPNPVVFLPVIDGEFNATEWANAENKHAVFAETDAEHNDTYNYVFSGRTTDSLYILVDLCSDTTDDALTGEWISLILDTDNSKKLPNFKIWNTSYDGTHPETREYITFVEDAIEGLNQDLSLQNGTEALFLNVTTMAHSITLNTTTKVICQSTVTFTVDYGFSTSLYSSVPHRIFEFKIALSSINNMTQVSDYGLLVQGYGTMGSPTFSHTYNESTFYSLMMGSEAVYLGQVLSWAKYVESNNWDESNADWPNTNTTGLTYFLLASMEQMYYPCGPGSSVHDLVDNPNFFGTSTYTGYRYYPTIDGTMSTDDHWEYAENVHTGLIHSDFAHDTNYNFLYTSRVNNSLYVCVDLVSDTVNTPNDAEWLGLWIQTNFTQTYDPFYTWGHDPATDSDVSNELLYQTFYQLAMKETYGYNGFEGVFINMSTGSHDIQFSEIDYGGPVIRTTYSTANFQYAMSFGTSPNSATNHRVFEFKIPINELTGMTNTSDYRIFVSGYGSLLTPDIVQDFNEPGLFTLGMSGATVYLSQIFGWLGIHYWEKNDTNQVFPNAESTTQAIYYTKGLWRGFFPCGSSANVSDLRDNSQTIYFDKGISYLGNVAPSTTTSTTSTTTTTTSSSTTSSTTSTSSTSSTTSSTTSTSSTSSTTSSTTSTSSTSSTTSSTTSTSSSSSTTSSTSSTGSASNTSTSSSSTSNTTETPPTQSTVPPVPLIPNRVSGIAGFPIGLICVVLGISVLGLIRRKYVR